MPKPRKSPKHTRKRNCKLHKPNHIIKGGISSTYKEVFYKPNWIKFFGCQWTTLVKLKGTFLYATSIPDENTHKCLATFLFYMFVKDICRIISLQACDESNPKVTENCEGFIPDGNDLDDKYYESRMWIGLGNSYGETHKEGRIEFKNHKIKDFTAGNLRTWFELLNYDYYNDWQKTIIHCLAGFGRTGSILLMVYMNTYYQNNRNKANELNNKFFHYSSSSELYTELRKELSEAIELDIDDADVNDPRMPPENGEVNDLIKSVDKNKITEEVFNIEDYSEANTLITRMNYIRICLGTKFKQDTIFLFQLMPMPIDWKKKIDVSRLENLFSSFQAAVKEREQEQLIAITPETIFSSEGREPVQINLSDIETISKQVDNPYGIKV